MFARLCPDHGPHCRITTASFAAGPVALWSGPGAAIVFGIILCVLPRGLLWWPDAHVDLRSKEDFLAWVRTQFHSDTSRKWKSQLHTYLSKCKAQRRHKGSQVGPSLEEICCVLSVRTRFKPEHRAEIVLDIVKSTVALMQNDLPRDGTVSAGSSKDTLEKSVSIAPVDSPPETSQQDASANVLKEGVDKSYHQRPSEQTPPRKRPRPDDVPASEASPAAFASPLAVRMASSSGRHLSPAAATALAESIRKSPCPTLRVPQEDIAALQLRHRTPTRASALTSSRTIEAGLLKVATSTFKEFFDAIRTGKTLHGLEWLPKRNTDEDQARLHRKLEGFRRRYKTCGAADDRRNKPLSIEEMWLLSLLPGVLGSTTFGEIEAAAGDKWVWKIMDADWHVASELYVSKDIAIEELAVVQAGLFPDWHDVSKRHSRVLYLKSKLQEESRYAAASVDAVLGDFLPADAERHSSQFVSGSSDATNYFPGFRNLGNTCYFNAVLQCLKLPCRPCRFARACCGRRPD
jgi:hypothetical protein